MTPAAVEPVTWGAIVFMFVVLLLEVSATVVVAILAWKWFWVAIKTVQPVHIDGALYVQIAVYGGILAWVSSDDAYKYISPYVIFYTKGLMGALLAGSGALKMFRSTGYSDSLKKPVDTAPKPPDAPK